MFLNQNPMINNRLDCLVRELLELLHLNVGYLVLATHELHIVEPFYCKTIDKFATHSELKEFYRNLHTSMDMEVEENIFSLSRSAFDGISEDLFCGVKERYGSSG